MSNGAPQPPSTEEVDIGPGGTKIGNKNVVSDANITTINSIAEGTIHVETVNGVSVAQFAVVKLVGSQKVTIKPITKIQIPFGSDTLFVENQRGVAVWTFKGAPVGTYNNPTSLDWRSDMVTPSGTQVIYWQGSTQTPLPWAEFDEMKLTVDVP